MSRRNGRYDAVVVGGGHNGLTAAAYLARGGLSCAVLERSERLGGAAVSERIFPDFDASLSRYAYLVSLLPQSIAAELGLALRLKRRRVSSYTPDPRREGARGLLVSDEDRRATGRSFAAVTGDPAAEARWRAFYGRTRELARRAFPTLSEPLRSREGFAALVGADAWADFFERPIGECVAEALGDELTCGVALTDALIGTFAAAGDPTLVQNACFLYHVIGRQTGEWLAPVGGMGAVSGALERAARGAGARIVTGARVLSLEPADGEVNVVFEAGARRELRAGAVLVNAAPSVLAELLGEAAPAPAEGSQLKVNMLLERLPRLREAAVAPETAFAGTFHVNETAGQLQRAYERAAAGELPDPVPCEVYCHSLADPTILGAELRQRGVQTLTVFALHMPHKLFAADPDGGRERALAATLASLDSLLAEPIGECLLRDREGRPCIEACTPVDLEAELALPLGNIFHRELRWPFAEDPQEVGRWGVETAHERVLLCGAGARRGGGVSGIAGRNAARALLAAGPR